jgi:hypothetical protein
MKNYLRITALLALAALPAAAATFTIYNTGQGPEGLADPNWTLSGGTAYVTIDGQFPFGPWLANSVDSNWISPHPSYASSSSNDVPGTYTYSTTFDLTGLNPGTASLSFVVAADDEVTDVLLNGVSQGVAHVGFSGFSGLFTLNSDFIGGINTIAFVTNNAGSVNTPTGLRVEFSDATADALSGVPEPSSIALLGFGAILLFSRRFRSAKQ